MRYLWFGLAFIWAQEAVCGFESYESWLRSQYPDLPLWQAQIDATAFTPVDVNLRTEPGCTPSRYVIPVVFHVIYSSASDSVSHERIFGQLWRLHEDFRRIPETSGYNGVGADTEIEFSIATKAPNGRDTLGIVYWRYNQPPLNWTRRDFCRESQDQTMKQATAWDPTKYLNIWIVPRLCVAPGGQPPCNPNNCGDVAGYAYFPFSPASVYGSVIGERYFWGSGITSRSSRTTVHEVGHNLNLYHPFESGCGSANCSTSGDRVCDTPPTSGQNFSVVRQNTCTNDSPDRPDNTRNIMDYVSDPDMNHFTFGQRARAWSAINNTASRLYPLTRPSNQAVTGTGPHGLVKAYFTAYPRVACVGQPVKFYGTYSHGLPDTYIWDFGGGTPDDRNSSCPTVTFSAPGSYTVRLIVQNQSGRRDTLVKANYILVQDTAFSVPYVEGFEGTNFPPDFSYIDNPDAVRGGRTWERFRSTTTPRGAFGQSPSCMRIPYFSYSYYQEKDSWVTPTIELPVLPNGVRAFLRFSYAYACLDYENLSASRPSYQLDYEDSLRVYVSTDCGATWSLLWEKGGRDLATRADQCITVSGNLSSTHSFLPTASEWDSVEVDLSAFGGQNVKIRFEGVSGWGNNLFLDDIRVDAPGASSIPLPVASVRMAAQLRAEALSFTISENLPQGRLDLYDAIGRCVWHYEGSVAAGTHTWNFSTALPQGLYILRVETPHQLWTARLIP